jgi:hypothetical protein
VPGITGKLSLRSGTAEETSNPFAVYFLHISKKQSTRFE